MGSLFPNADRWFDGPAEFSEGHYAYLQRTGRKDFALIRAAMESWFSRYPVDHQGELRSRLQSGDDRHFRSAFFELFLHEVLCRLGCQVTVHPETTGRPSTRPDFLVEGREGECFFLEATEASSISDEDAAAEKRINQVYDSLNKLNSPDFYIGIQQRGSPKVSPSGRKLRKFLEEKLSRLDIGLLEAGDLTHLPRWPICIEGWELTFFPIPKPPGSRGSSEIRPLALIMPGEFSRVHPEEPIKVKVIEKRKHYGRLERPLVIAVNALDPFADRRAGSKALFGDPTSFVAVLDAEGQLIDVPRPDGVWLGPRGPRRQDLPAVIFGKGIMPWTITRHELCLYVNPWADRPIGDALRKLPSLSLLNGEVTEVPGAPLCQLLDLPSDWVGEA